jgi:hypothetical protein
MKKRTAVGFAWAIVNKNKDDGWGVYTQGAAPVMLRTRSRARALAKILIGKFKVVRVKFTVTEV